MTSDGMWWGAIIGGFVVIVVVGVLLTILVMLVAKIDRHVASIKARLAQARDNTNDTVLIGQTADAVETVLAEGLEHHLFLTRVLEKVRY